jgi:putative component of membrane protein insertase Oxa1/YidC/SpoIIIJ protein YidD
MFNCTSSLAFEMVYIKPLKVNFCWYRPTSSQWMMQSITLFGNLCCVAYCSFEFTALFKFHMRHPNCI